MAIDPHSPLKNVRKPANQQLVLISLLLLVVFCSIYFSVFFKPLQKKADKFSQEEKQLNDQTALSISQTPNLDKLRAELEDHKKVIKEIEARNQVVETKLLSEKHLNQFLTELIKCAEGLQMEIQNVKQSVDPDKPGFSRLHLSMKIESRYEAIVNYVNRIEKISPYVKIEGLDLAQAEIDPRNLVSADIKLEAILATDIETKSILSAVCSEKTVQNLTVTKSPMIPNIKTVEKKVRNLTLAGITFGVKGKNSSAIINDTVVREGDEIEGQMVKKILSDSVVLNDGQEDYTLLVDR